MNTKKICFPRISGSMFRKVSLLTLLAFALLVSPMVAYGATVTLAWDANTEPDLAGYKIHYGTASADYTHSIDVGNITQYTLADLDDGTAHARVTAFLGHVERDPLQPMRLGEVRPNLIGRLALQQVAQVEVVMRRLVRARRNPMHVEVERAR